MERPGSRISRRAFLRAAGVGAGVGAVSSIAPLRAGDALADAHAEREVDVIVVGTGAGAWPAAILAHDQRIHGRRRAGKRRRVVARRDYQRRQHQAA